MKSRPLPSKQELDRLVKYDPDTGEFFWRVRPVTMFAGLTTDLPRSIKGPCSPEWACNQWNARHAGQRATSWKKDGYHYCCISYRRLLAHRVAWKIMTGLDPVEVDHIDGNRANNKWTNLRNGTRSDNLRNTALKRTNKSGYHGVSFSKRSQNWFATINLGTFDTKEEAIAARKKAEEMLGFHPNHGREFVDRTRTNPLPFKSKSGERGVVWEDDRECWLAHMTINGQYRFLGRFINKEDAIAARKRAEEEHNGEIDGTQAETEAEAV